MAKGIEIYIERELVITDWTYHKGCKERINCSNDDARPAEPEEVEDITGYWSDTKEPLTDKEFDAYKDRIEEDLLERIHADQERDYDD